MLYRTRKTLVLERYLIVTNTITIAWKELKIYFQTPTAYVVAAMFVGFAGITFILNVIGTNPEASVRSLVVPSSIFYI